MRPENARGTHRILPQNKRRIVLQRQIPRLLQNIRYDTPARLVFLLFEVPHASESELDVGRNLEGGTVEGSGFLFRQTSLILHVSRNQLSVTPTH